MRSVSTPINEKAARPGQVTKAATTNQQRVYHRRGRASTKIPQQPANRTTRTDTPARRPGSCQSAGLGLLVTLLALHGGKLGGRQQADAWRHVAHWAAEIVDARQTQEEAA